MTAADYKELRRWLTKGEVSELAGKNSRSRQTMSRHLNGRVKKIDTELMDKVTAIVIERQNLIIGRMKQIHDNAKQINDLTLS